MAPDDLDTARSRYASAYAAYRQAAKLVSEKLASGSVPSVEELENEAKAIERLAIARREVLDAIGRLAPPR
jgi:hypothetical protein